MAAICECLWCGTYRTIGEAVPFLKPCAGHEVYGDYRANQARKNIVSWLRGVYKLNKPAQDFADAIERGEDLKHDMESGPCACGATH